MERTADRKAARDRRLGLKTQEHQLKAEAIKGAGLSPWEAEMLVEVVNQVLCSGPADRPLAPGQMRYLCVSAAEGAQLPRKLRVRGDADDGSSARA